MAQNEAVSPGEGAAVLEALFQQSPTGLLILDTELRILRINLTKPDLHDVPHEQIVGRHVTDVYDLSAPGEVESMLHSVLENGAPARERLVALRPKGAPGPEYLFSVSASRLDDSQGRTWGVLTEMLDVTEREKAHARIRVLGSVREHVGRTLNVVATCQELVRAVVPDLADIAVVEVVDAVVRGEEPPRARWDRRCRCAVPPSVTAAARSRSRHIRWATCALCRSPRPTPRRWPTSNPASSPWHPRRPGWQRTRHAPRRSAYPVPAFSSRHL
ncbi:PAS domain-containing protein [Streptomyces sp. NPDC059629]|uniref:PAS domain-containing protein n=1 Tax=Streptomyces sp. NPDC059629 TaxID=3346889 RepID=UPI003696C9AA